MAQRVPAELLNEVCAFPFVVVSGPHEKIARCLTFDKPEVEHTPLVFRLAKKTDSGIFLHESSNHLLSFGAVRSIVGDNNVKVSVGLSRDAIQGGSQLLRTVVGRNSNADQWFHSFNRSLVGLNENPIGLKHAPIEGIQQLGPIAMMLKTHSPDYVIYLVEQRLAFK